MAFVRVWELLMQFKWFVYAVFESSKLHLFAVRNFPLMRFKRDLYAISNNYGDIFDLSRDGPQFEDENNQEVKNKSLVDQIGHIQLSLFPA